MEGAKDGGNKILFVTVGSHKFDDLIKQIDTKDFHIFLRRQGFAKMTMQIGEGTYEPKLTYRHSRNKEDFLTRVKFFRYKKDLQKDLQKADLILSHAGSGTTIEGLRMKKKMLIVVNDKLKDNHQLAFARFLHSLNYLEPEPFLRDLRALMEEAK
ncbi:beta-1,4-N-acetylglucosaminyltransferase [Plasmodium inui San Antonio 1]|uniref:UDP-N-acetylglucosamine transferase subunit ALG13 n=1 Tax=Plasmodium inui San Antonio 1 TaxID=1237626 RepID=W7AMS3_9APIC|nr:beta-1,4-N-acetylglucosaminyltransferase [Plasmodium inui San Antonio 1]EUD66601.1 beta-1,4-N-acetylglucosaminyltransferase [Plasmodium inui San Antonio 1]